MRRAAGEQPTEAEYRRAYPGEADGKVIAAAFRRCADAEGEPARPLPMVSGDATTAALRLRTLDNAAGPVIEGYVILGILGRGGMGTVFLAQDNQLGRKAAIKTMRPELAAKAENRVRFLREARAAAAIEHDNVVPIWQVGQAADGSPFIVMPFLQGETLESRLKREPVQPLGILLQMAREMAEALAAADARGLTHRDIKPANVWVEGDPDAQDPGKQVRRCKVLDFGLARAANEDVQLTQSGAIVGTPAYVAPEQARGEKVDHRCDLFSLGCVLYRMATGKLPFKGDTTMAVLLSLAADAPQSVCELNPNLPPRLARLIEALLAKRPTERPASASVVIAEIEAIQRELASPAPVPALGRSPGDEATLELAQPVPAAAPKKRSRGSLVAAALGLMALVAAVGLGVVLWMQTPDGKVVRIECDDPDIKVAFEKGEFKVTGAYKEPLALKPGKIGLKVKKGEDFEFETDKLIVHKGDKIVLKIEVVAGKVQIVQDGKGVLDSKELPVVKGDLDRRAAEYVLSIGGTVHVRLNDQERDIIAVAGLPKENFVLTQVHLWKIRR